MNFAERTPHLTWAWVIVSTVILLAGAVRGQPPTGFGGRSRFDSTFANDVHAPRASDADVLRTLTRYKNDQWLIVYGKFFGDGSRAAVVTGLKHASNADSLTTLLMYKEADGWKVRSEDDALNAAYCRVVPITSDKDILLCQTNHVRNSNGGGSVDTNLYTLDFTREPPDSFFLQLRDTVGTSSSCRTWANLLGSIDVTGPSLHLSIEYGRRGSAIEPRGNPSNFSRTRFQLRFVLGPGGFSPAEGSMRDYRYVTERWDRTGACSTAKPQQ